MEERLLRKLEVTAENGTTYVLHFYRELISNKPLAGTQPPIPSWRRITTEDGAPVTYLEKGKYRHVGTGEVLRSSAPDAP